MEFWRFLLVLIVPGLIGALAFSLAARFKTEIDIKVASILSLLAFFSSIVFLLYGKGVETTADLVTDFGYSTFTWKYILLSIGFAIVWGTLLGVLRRLFFWVRK